MVRQKKLLCTNTPLNKRLYIYGIYSRFNYLLCHLPYLFLKNIIYHINPFKCPSCCILQNGNEIWSLKLHITIQSKCFHQTINMELEEKIFVWDNLMLLMKEFQFVMSLKNWRSTEDTVCYAPTPMKSQICYHSNYGITKCCARHPLAEWHPDDVTLTSLWCLMSELLWWQIYDFIGTGAWQTVYANAMLCQFLNDYTNCFFFGFFFQQKLLIFSNNFSQVI